MIVPDITKASFKESSRNTSFSASTTPIRDTSSVNAIISEGILLYNSDFEMNFKILKSFSVQISHIEEGFVVTSSLSDIYEVGDFAGETIRAYLSSLIDELMWLQERKEHLSDTLLQQLNRIHSYLTVVY